MNPKKRQHLAREVLRKRHPYQRAILQTLVLGGVLGIGMLAPNALGVLAQMDPNFQKDKRSYRRFQETLWRMEGKGLITKVRKGKGLSAYALTKKGKGVIDAALTSHYQISTPLMWDGKWRIVMFDIPERRRSARQTLRTMLARAGFVRLQDSVWVHPYPCDDFVLLLRAHLKSARGELHHLVTDFVESDRFLRQRFNLS